MDLQRLCELCGLGVVIAAVSDGHIELNEMVDDAAKVAKTNGGFVVTRVGGMASLVANAGVPHVYDVHMLEGALSGSIFADVASLSQMPTNIQIFREVTGLDANRTVAPDGTSTVVASNTDLAAATVGLPAIKLPDGKDVWDGFRLHALLYTLHGDMTPIMRRKTLNSKF